MRILILHNLSDSYAGYSRAIDHHAHDVTYVGLEQRIATVPADVPCRALIRPPGDDAAAAILRVTQGLPKPDLVIAMSEFDLLPAAQVRQTLAVPGPTVDDVLPVRDKVVMKTAVAAAGIKVPRFARLSDAMADDAAPLPWSGRTVLKPIAGMASQQTYCFPTPAAAIDAVRRNEVDAFAHTHEIEQFVQGHILHVDGLMADARPLVIQAGQYVGTSLEYAAGAPYGSTQTDTPPALVDWTLHCLRAVGIDDGPFHLEAIETPDGLVFMEVAARCAGGGILDGFELATGIWLPTEAIRLMVEGPANVPTPRSPNATELYGYFTIPGHTLGSTHCRISGEEPFRADPLVHRWYQWDPGEPIKQTFSYSCANVPLGAVLGPAPTDELRRYMTRLFATVSVTPHGPTALAQ